MRCFGYPSIFRLFSFWVLSDPGGKRQFSKSLCQNCIDRDVSHTGMVSLQAALTGKAVPGVSQDRHVRPQRSPMLWGSRTKQDHARNLKTGSQMGNP